MILHWPQITLILLSAIGLVMVVRQHGQTTAHSSTIWTAIITFGLIAWIQYKGGFFDSTGLPQLIMIIYFGFAIGNSMMNAGKHVKYNMCKGIAYAVVYQGAMIAGGFYGNIG